MAYVQMWKDGKLVMQRALDSEAAQGDGGYVVDLESGQQVRLAPGESARIGEYEVCVSPGSAPAGEPEPQHQSQIPTASDGDTEPSRAEDASFPQIEGYRITGKISQEGGQGTVWRAMQLGTSREVALKFLRAGAFSSPQAQARFEREVELTSRLEHPNIARVYDSDLCHGVFYYAMELIDGVHLDDYVEQNELAQPRVLALMQTVCWAVHHAHRRGIIHRDLKPSNVMVTPDGQPHVLDFGLAKSFEEGDHSVTASIDDRPGPGTVPYMSPEQAAGHVSQLDARTDVYSLGVILFRLLTGEYPHDQSGTGYEVARRIAEHEARRPRKVSRQIDAELEALLLKALAHEPDQRYAWAGDLADDIRNYLAGEPLTARRPTTLYLLRKRVRKYRLRIATAVVVLSALVSMATFAYEPLARQRDEAVAASRQEKGKRIRADKKATEARREAEVAKAETEAAKAEAEAGGRTLYFNRIALAQAELRQDHVQPASQELALCPKDLRGWEWHRLQYLCNGRAGSRDLPPRAAVRRLQGHGGAVEAISFSPRGNHMVSGGQDGTLRIWDVAAGRQTRVLPAHDGAVLAVAVRADGKAFASAGTDGRVRTWDFTTARMRHELPTGQKPVLSVCYSLRGEKGKWRITATCRDGTVKMWNAGEGAEVAPLDDSASTGAARCAALRHDARRMACGSQDGTAWVWDISKGRLRRDFQLARSKAVVSVAFSPLGFNIASGNQDGTVSLWDNRGKRQWRVPGHAGPVHSVTFSPDGTRVVSAGQDGTVRLWDTISGARAMSLRPDRGQIRSIAFSHDAATIAAGSSNGEIQVWDAPKASAR